MSEKMTPIEMAFFLRRMADQLDPLPTSVTVTSPSKGRLIIRCKPPNSAFLQQDITTVLFDVAMREGLDIVVVHGSAEFQGQLDENHGWKDFDLEYQRTPLDDARVFLALIDRLPITKSTLPDPSPRQKLSAALSELDYGNHEDHAHVPEQGQIVVSPRRRQEILKAAEALRC